jgi:hypothetical protein
MRLLGTIAVDYRCMALTQYRAVNRLSPLIMPSSGFGYAGWPPGMEVLRECGGSW